MSGFIPRVRILTEPGLLYTAIGILGATVMPHNLFLHSAIVQTRNYPRTAAGEDRMSSLYPLEMHPNSKSAPVLHDTSMLSDADATPPALLLTRGVW